MSEPDPISAVAVSHPFRPSQSLDEMEGNGIEGATELRAAEETAHAELMATPILHMEHVSKAGRSTSVELWARQKKTPAWLLKAAAVGARWQIGEEFDPLILTEAEFDAAVSFAANPHAHANPVKGK